MENSKLVVLLLIAGIAYYIMNENNKTNVKKEEETIQETPDNNIDCEWSEYGEWSECKDGKQIATRTIKTPKSGSGKDCTGENTKSQSCYDSQGLSHGEPFMCKGDNTGAVNRYMKENSYSWIPNPETFYSWYGQDNWGAIKKRDIDCTKLINLNKNVPSGPGSGKKSIKCDSGPAVYNFDSETQSYAHYINPDVASSYDPLWGQSGIIDCSYLTQKDPLIEIKR